MLVVKYGGNAMGADSDDFMAQCAEIVHAGRQIVLVHGGGPQIDAELKKSGIAEQRAGGLRITDEPTLAVVEHVLCGTVNKSLVRGLARRGVAAVGLSGQDGGLITARHADPIDGVSLGFVGEVESVNPRILRTLLADGFIPIIAPLGISADGVTRYNLNADTVAGAVAGALNADPYVVVTDVPRVRRDPRDATTGIDRMDLAEARELFAAGSFDGGMRPKMLAVFAAFEQGAKRAIIVGGPNAMERAFSGDGTRIEA